MNWKKLSLGEDSLIEQQNRETAVYRVLLLTGAISITLFGFIIGFVNPQQVDPMIQRYIFSALCLLTFTLSYTHQFVRKHLYPII